MFIERRSLGDVMAETPELSVRGDWLCLNVEVTMAWPTSTQSFVFEGERVWLIPYTSDYYPGLALDKPPSISRDDAWALLHRALSLLAWTEGSGAMVAYMSRGDLPRMMERRSAGGTVVRHEFDLSDLPQLPDGRASLALALMREARGLNHPAYAFLTFFRALETALPSGHERGRWVTANIDRIQGHNAKAALRELRKSVIGDIGEHLRQSGRHAIAHARSDPVINPDDPRDAKRLGGERPIIEGLAVLAIEEKLGVQTKQTIWNEHLYELRGWKPVFGNRLIGSILRGEPPEEGAYVDAPVINVRLRKSTPFEPFERMLPVQATPDQCRVEMIYRSADGRLDLRFWLNFADERLLFDVDASIAIRDDGSAAAARNYQSLDRFLRDYYANGELQIWNAETSVLMSRCDAFMPFNCFLDFDAANAAIARWAPIIAERELAEAK